MEAFKEVDDSAFVCSPRKTSELDTSVDIFFTDTVTAANVLAFRVEAFEGFVIFSIKISKENPSATNLLLLLVLEGALSITRGLEQYCCETSFLTLFVDLPLERLGHIVVAVKELDNVFFGCFPRQSFQSKSSFLDWSVI